MSKISLAISTVPVSADNTLPCSMMWDVWSWWDGRVLQNVAMESNFEIYWSIYLYR